MRFVGIDPSTKTGFVALNQNGDVLKEKELKGIGTVDPKRIVTLTDEIMAHIRPGDVICIEGVPFDTQRAAQAGWIHGSIRNALFRTGFSYFEAAPNGVKKYVSVTGWVGEKGSMRRLKGPEKKKAVKVAVKEHFGYSHSNDNIVDAYILSRIALHIYQIQQDELTDCYVYQQEVVNQILNPVPKPKKKKVK